MFSVKGLPDNTGLIKPSTTTVAIAEIIFMITVAFLLGFGLAWIMRNEPLEMAMDEVHNSRFEIRDLKAQINSQQEAVTNWEKIAQQSDERAASAELASAQLTSRISELTAQEELSKKKSRDLETKIQILDGEISSSKFRVRVLEAEIADKDKAIGALMQQVDEADSQPKAEHRDWSDHPFVRPVDASPDERDELTEIKGIGPAFQKKLNLLDIYTFRQLSELDGEAVERLAELVEVFPERIHRDNWIGQATRLYMKKLGREV
jgi:predicted flap endonuclease-1-like 5' DNA nuclease